MIKRFTPAALITLLLSSGILIALSAASADDGPFGNIAFQHSILVSSPADENVTQTLPSSASSRGYLYIAWQEYTFGSSDIYMKALNLTTQEWSSPVMIDDSRRNSQFWDDGSSQKKVAISAWGRVVAATWMDDREGKYLVYSSISQDAGRSFGRSFPVWVDSAGVQKDPDVAIQGETVYVVWEDTDEAPTNEEGRIYFCKGIISGTSISFGVPVAVSPPVSVMSSKDPAIWVDEEGGIYVVWSGMDKSANGDWDIYLSLSFNGGDTFTVPLNLVEETGTSSQWLPDIVASGNNILVVWQDYRRGNWDIYGTASYDGGSHFTQNFRVSKDSSGRGQYTPSLALSPNGTVYVAFSDLRAGGEDYEIYMDYTTDWGREFWGDYRVSDDTLSKSQINPTATAPGLGDAALFVAYEDNRDNHFRIRLSRWIPGRGMVSLPYLTDVHVTPEAGSPGEYFYFKATYYHTENVPPAPGYPRVWLYYMVNDDLKVYPGSPFKMKRRLMPAQDFIYTNGEEYILGMKIKNAVPYFFQVEAKAEGNVKSVFSDMRKGPIVDDTPPVCVRVSPVLEGWSPERTVLCEAVFRDDGSGVDPRYVEVSYSYSGGENLIVWHHVQSVEFTDNTTCIAKFEVILSNGTGNVVQFRASDRVGNGYTYSPLLRFKYDGEPPHFKLLQPSPGRAVHSQEVTVKVLINDPGGTGIVPESVQYRFSTSGIMGYSPWRTPEERELEKNSGGYILTVNLQLKWGWDNFLQVKAVDKTGNSGVSLHFQIPAIQISQPSDGWGNRPPEKPRDVYPHEISDPHPHLFWPASKDPDGDQVTYRIRIGTSPGEGDVVGWTDLGVENYFDVPDTVELQPGNTYYVEVMATDGKLNSSTVAELRVADTANSPPSPPGPLYPSTIPVETRVINWDPSWDPDGDPVLYFVRIGSSPGQDNIMSWRTTYKDRFVELPSWLGPGVYWVQLMASDGMSFSRVATYKLIVGIFRVKVTSVDRVTVRTTDDDSISLNITNLGTATDEFVVSLGGSALYTDGINITPTRGDSRIYPGASSVLTFNITTHSARPGTYYLNFTVVSPITSASARLSVMIEVIGKGGGIPSGLQPTPAKPTLRWYHIGIILFFAALGVLIVREIYLLYRARRGAE